MADGAARCLPLPVGEVAQWQSRGLISPWLGVQISPSPFVKGSLQFCDWAPTAAGACFMSVKYQLTVADATNHLMGVKTRTA